MIVSRLLGALDSQLITEFPILVTGDPSTVLVAPFVDGQFQQLELFSLYVLQMKLSSSIQVPRVGLC